MEQPTEEFALSRNLSVKEKREKYFRLYREILLPQLFDNYWTLVFEERFAESQLTKKQIKRDIKKEKLNPLTPFHYPFIDIFKQGMTETDPLVKKKGKLTVECVIPMTRYHWDTILFMYHLLFYQTMESTGHVATYLMSFLQKNKIKPNHINNFHPEIWNMLLKHRNGEYLEAGTQNWMMVDPISNYYMMMRGHLLLTLNFQGDETDTQLKELLDALQDKISLLCQEYFVDGVITTMPENDKKALKKYEDRLKQIEEFFEKDQKLRVKAAEEVNNIFLN